MRLHAVLSLLFAATACSSPGVEEGAAAPSAPPAIGAPDAGETIATDDAALTSDAATIPRQGADAAESDASIAPPGPSDASAEATPPGSRPPACGEVPEEPGGTTPSTLPRDEFAQIPFWAAPAGGDVVALTFDDGPRPQSTEKILDILAKEGIRATFFLNSRDTTSLPNSAAAKATVQRMVREGHVLGNHTANHHDLGDPSTNVDRELAQLEEDVRAAAPCAPPITLIRAPFGSPYLAAPSPARSAVMAIVARRGVHVGWTIDPADFECADAKCIVDGVNRRLDRGRRGPILLHDTLDLTVEALPQVIAEIRKRGIGFVTAERMVRDRYGKTSAELLAAARAK
jgi:peptidoglycan/xylan/chitin deacetylase (PgdA/CDA1 family)